MLTGLCTVPNAMAINLSEQLLHWISQLWVAWQLSLPTLHALKTQHDNEMKLQHSELAMRIFAMDLKSPA